MGIFNYHWNIKIDVALQNYSIGIKSTPIKLKHKQWMICNIKERRPRCGGASFFIKYVTESPLADYLAAVADGLLVGRKHFPRALGKRGNRPVSSC